MNVGYEDVMADNTEIENKVDTKDLEIDEQKLSRAQSLEAISRLAGGVVHDLNNKLMVINASIDMAAKQIVAQPKVTRKLLSALVATEQASQIISQLMSLFSPKDTSPRYVKVSDQLSDVVEFLRRSLISRNIQIDMRIADATLAVAVEVGEFQAAIVNLIVRLGDLMPDGGHISVVAEPVSVTKGNLVNPDMEGSFVKISVSGVIFSELPNGKKLDLEQWSRTDLLQVRTFAENSSGVLQFEEVTDNDFITTLYLPEVDVAVLSDKGLPVDEFRNLSDTMPLNNKATAGSEILVVDDEVEVAIALQSVLEKIGYKSRIAIGAKEAATAIADKRPSMVLSDIAMRGQSGIDLARDIRSYYPNLPIVLITGDRRLVQDDVEFPLLSKPISTQKLAIEIHRNLLSGVQNIVPLVTDKK